MPALPTAAQPITPGSLLDFPADPLGCMRALQRAHGDVAALEEGRQRIVFVFSPELNQQVLTDTETFHSRFFAIAGPRNSAQRRVTSGLLSMNGQEHKRHRRMVIGPFQRKAIAGYQGQLVELVEEMLSPWRPGQVRNIFADMKQFMLRVTSAILFGVDHPEIAFEIGHLMEEWVEQNHRLGVAALVPLEGQQADYERLLDIAEQVEARLVKMIELKRASTAPGFDVLSLLLRAYDDDGHGMTDAELIGQAAILYGAAHLTTTNSLSWALFLLAQHPEVMRELHAELAPLAGDPPTPEQLDQLPALGRVVDESLRVLTPSAYSQRLTVEPAQLGPLKLGRGTIVVFSQYITHHRADLFDDPDRFVPDRWLSIKPSPYAYLPFGAGPRMCLGATLAMTTIKLALATILGRYRLTVQPGARIDGHVLSTMLTPTAGMPMIVAHADGRCEASPVTGNIHSLVKLDESLVARDKLRIAA